MAQIYVDFPLVIGYQEMSNFLVVSIHETNKIFFVKCFDINTFFIIEAIDKVSILYYHHPLSTALVNHIVSKTLLVCLSEGILGVCAELTVIWRIQEYEVFFCRICFS